MVMTIRLPDFLSIIQVTIQLVDHSAIGLLWAIWLPDVSDNPMSTVHLLKSNALVVERMLKVY